MQRTIHAMKDLVLESVNNLTKKKQNKISNYYFQELEFLSIADSKLKENTADFLLSLSNNTSLKILDIR